MRAFSVRRAALTALAVFAVFAVALVVFVLATLPASPRPVAGADPALLSRTFRGAFHVHTTRSDGAADKPAVAAAARRAGLQFVVFTDHGDGTRAADRPEYLDGVLCLDGVEISTNGGHYIALGAAASPYPLGGESAAVVEDVSRLGGFGVAAHPVSARPSLAWGDWSLPFDGVEWLNADSEWRDESRWQLARAFAAYPWRSAPALAALLDRPAALAQIDRIASARQVVAFAGHDAHGGIGRRLEDPSSRRHIPVPSYEASFRTFSLRVLLDRRFTGDAGADGSAVLAALKGGAFYTAIDAVASGGTFVFTARTPAEDVGEGSVLRSPGVASFTARAAVPDGATTVAFRNGVEILRRPGGDLQFDSAETGAFRVEVHVDGSPGNPAVPWIVSNPIFRLPPAVEQPPHARGTPVLSLRNAVWRIEKSEGSAGAVRVDPESGEVAFEYRLREGPRASQFVALVADLPADVADYEAITFAGRAEAPRRASVQLRFARDADARWLKSVYLDPDLRLATVLVDELRRADGPPSRPVARRATSLLFVVDLTNANPGDGGVVRIRDVELVSR